MYVHAVISGLCPVRLSIVVTGHEQVISQNTRVAVRTCHMQHRCGRQCTLCAELLQMH